MKWIQKILDFRESWKTSEILNSWLFTPGWSSPVEWMNFENAEWLKLYWATAGWINLVLNIISSQSDIYLILDRRESIWLSRNFIQISKIHSTEKNKLIIHPNFSPAGILSQKNDWTLSSALLWCSQGNKFINEPIFDLNIC